MPVGTPLPDDLIDAWLEQDAHAAWGAAAGQAIEIHCEDLREALASVCYQLGPGWKSDFKKTWQLLQAGLWEDAAIEAADSKWYVQTPVRVIDFQWALWNQAIQDRHDPQTP